MAYPLLNQMLDSLLPVPVSSSATAFTLPPLPVSSRDTATTTTSTSTLPPISSLMSTAVQTSPPSSQTSSTLPSASSSTTLLPLLPHDAVATSSHLQQYDAVRRFTTDLQQRKPRHPKRFQLPQGEAGTPVRRVVHTAMNKQNLNQYNNTLKVYENYFDELLKQTTAELNKIITNVHSVAKKLKPTPVSKLRR